MAFLHAAVLLAVLSWPLRADEPARDPARRAKPPKFDRAETAKVFFPDVFAMLQGERPVAGSAAAAGTGSMSSGAPEGAPEGDEAGGSPWSRVISASSIEDEVKALRVALNESITTPTQFAGRGHKQVRRQFALLTVLFWAIEHYGSDVRWKQDAQAAREKFGSVTGNAKAGGNAQTYAQAKGCRDLLDQLIRGERIGIDPSEDDVEWESVAPRRPLMYLLENRFEANLKEWSRDEGAVKSHAEELLREAELVAMIAQFLQVDGMDDADDEEYQKFCNEMRDGALQVVQGIRQNAPDLAQKGVSAISTSCANCHDAYR